MSDIRRLGRPECEEVLNELEEVKAETLTAREVYEALTPGSSEHARACADCRGAVEDFVVTRAEVSALKGTLADPGPWFTARVMSAVKAAERELEERKEGVWVSVRRLAPRLAAFAALLLVLGGTWAMELRRQEAAGQAQTRQSEGLFEAGQSAPLNDEIVATAAEVTHP